MVANALFEVGGNSILEVAFCFQVAQETIENLLETFWMSVLCLNMRKQGNQGLGVFIEEAIFNSKFLSDLLPVLVRPVRIVNIDKCWMVEKSWTLDVRTFAESQVLKRDGLCWFDRRG